MSGSLLDALRHDSMERLRFLVCRRVGLIPGSLSARLLTKRQVLTLACHLALEQEGEAESAGGSFDMERFRALSGGRP